MPTRQDVVSDEREIEDGDIHEIQVRAPVNAPRHPEIDETQEERPAAETPLPKLQLFILLYIQLAEPITSTVIYPFVNQLVRKTGITGGDEDKTGYFAGLIESAFYATEAICVLQWGRASDRLGRKPIMMSGLLGLTLSMLGFGLAKTYWALILARCAEGVLNGNIGVTKSMMAEITDETNRDRGFAFMPMIWSLGSTLGPAIGGVVSTPASRWPRAFHDQFWTSYPYFLPCIIAACISMSGFVLALCGLKETLPRTKRGRKAVNIVPEHLTAEQANIAERRSDGEVRAHDTSATGSSVVFPQASTATKTAAIKEKSRFTSEVVEPTTVEPTAAAARPVTIRSILNAQVLYPILNYAFLAFTDQCTVVLLPLMYSSSIGEGGLGFSSLNIGIIQGITGILSGLIQILTFPWFRRRFGNKRLYIGSYAWYLFYICCFPLLAFLAKRAGRADGAAWAVIVLQNASYAATNFGKNAPG